MTLEKELLDFTNWLVDNKWTLVGNGLCLNNDTKKLASIGELVRQSNSLKDYYEQDFQVGEIVREKNSGDEVEIKTIEYNKFDNEYQYWYEDEDGEEWYGFADEFEKIN
jgi:hypothetical protein